MTTHGVIRNLVDRAFFVFAPNDADPQGNYASSVEQYREHVTYMLNQLLEEAAILANKRKNTYGGEFADYYYGRNSAAEDIGDDIRAMKVQ